MSKKHFGSGKNYLNPDPRIRNLTYEDFKNIQINSKVTPLTDEQKERIKVMWPKLMKVEHRSFEEFLDGFTREGHPDREIKVYEWIVARLSHNPTTKEYLNLIRLSFEQCPVVLIREIPE